MNEYTILKRAYTTTEDTLTGMSTRSLTNRTLNVIYGRYAFY